MKNNNTSVKDIDTEAWEYVKKHLKRDKEYQKLQAKLANSKGVSFFINKMKLDEYVANFVENLAKRSERMKVGLNELTSEMTKEEVEQCTLCTDMIIYLADMVDYYSMEINSILGQYMPGGKIELYDKLIDAGKGAKDIIKFLGTTSEGYQNMIADNADEVRIMFESTYKTMVKKLIKNNNLNKK